MSSITLITKFTNELYIPLAVNNPSSVVSQSTPNNSVSLQSTIDKVERDILVNSLGITTYNELQTALLDLPNADQKWKDLVNGVKYDGKVWEGLGNDFSLLAYAIYYTFLKQNTNFYMAIGMSKPNSENAVNVNPTQKLVWAWENFLVKYQQRRCFQDFVYNYREFYYSDEFYNNEAFVSLFEFLTDKSADYGFDSSKFKFYKMINSLGI